MLLDLGNAGCIVPHGPMEVEKREPKWTFLEGTPRTFSPNPEADLSSVVQAMAITFRCSGVGWDAGRPKEAEQ